MSNFSFLKAEFKPLFEHAQAVENLVNSDARAACIRSRHALERAVHWLYDHVPAHQLRRPYDRSLNALLSEPGFRDLLGDTVWEKARLIQKEGNHATHGNRPIKAYQAQRLCEELFHIMYWLAWHYSRHVANRPAASVTFDAQQLPRLVTTQQAVAFTKAELQKQNQRHEQEMAELRAVAEERDAALEARMAAIAEREAAIEAKEQRQTVAAQTAEALENIDPELAAAQAAVTAAKQAAAAETDNHDYNEAQTRKGLIDVLLREAGWTVGEDAGEEVEVAGMPNNQGIGFVDYVLWGADGKPLAVVEAKRSLKSPQSGQQQAKLYADCLENSTGQRPIIFYSNGYATWLWDDTRAAPRAVQGFYTRAELAQLITRRQLARDPSMVQVKDEIAGRYYQKRAIKAIAEAFNQGQRSALLTMATGTGKTRTAIALVDVLLRANLVKRVLFLADRRALVKQAANAFKEHLPDSTAVNLVTEKDETGQIYLSTYPTMMGLIEERSGGNKTDRTRRFGIGHFDLVIIDEAHRSVYQKYRAIFDYFDSYLVGLTATPRDEVHRDTYALFGLEKGVPTDAYSLQQAVADEFLVPYKAMDVPLKFIRKGIKYDELDEEEREHWDALDWSADEDTAGLAPDEVPAAAINKQLFNTDTVDQMLKHLMENGLKVEAGDRLGKTIVFAVNQNHAEFIAKRFDVNYPHLKGHFAKIITHSVNYAQSLIDDFGKADGNPHIAISVDMLDTGIDVPEVLNLVFFKAVRSKVKFLQMIGRGTRLCDNLLGPEQDKTEFLIFDYCQNFQFFNENPDGFKGSLPEPLGKRLFTTRAELLMRLQSDRRNPTATGVRETAGDYGQRMATLQQDLTSVLNNEVRMMNQDNFVVRPFAEHVQHYAEAPAWQQLDDSDLGRLTTHVAGLPSELDQGHVTAKLFDLNCLYLQLAVLEKSPQFGTYQSRVMQIAEDLETHCSAVPVVQAQLDLIQAVQTQEHWQDITLLMIEQIRVRLRDLVQLIERKKQPIIYTVLQDEMGDATAVTLLDTDTGINWPQYRKKVERFIREHQDHITIARLRQNRPLTPQDLAELERFVFEEGELGSKDDFEQAFAEQPSLAVFIRQLVGLDRQAALEAFSQFLDEAAYSSSQIRFVNLIIDHLTVNGMIEPGMLYEPPFTGLHTEGVDGLFASQDAQAIVDKVVAINQALEAA